MKFQSILEKATSLVENKLSPKEVVILSALLILSFTGFVFLTKTYLLPYITTEHVRSVGEIREGMVGGIKTVNPFAPQNQNEKDLTKILFSGLVRKDNSPKGNKLDLAENLSVSEDRLSYTIKISPYAIFHDGSKITSDDVLFSFEGLQGNVPGFEQISGSKIDDQTVYFKLEKANPFFELNLDFPIVKKGMTSILQEGFVGSGEFKLNKLTLNDIGEVANIELVSFKRSNLLNPYLQKYTINFYQSEEALVQAIKENKTDLATGIRNNLLANANPKYSLATSSMVGTFVIFINQTKDNALKNQSVRHYISQSINRQDVVNQVFAGYATPIDSITPIASTTNIQATDLKKDGVVIKDGILMQEIESKDNEKEPELKPLKFTLSTPDAPELVASAELIKNQLKSAGVDIEIKILSKEEMDEKILQSKDYELFLFGFHVPSLSTYYNFFHSDQKKLNLSGYANKKVDSALEQIRSNVQESQVVDRDALATLSETLYRDMPVVFLYNSQFVITYNPTFKIKLPANIQTIDDRYQFVTDWYVETERVFTWFRDSKLIKFIESNSL